MGQNSEKERVVKLADSMSFLDTLNMLADYMEKEKLAESVRILAKEVPEGRQGAVLEKLVAAIGPKAAQILEMEPLMNPAEDASMADLEAAFQSAAERLEEIREGRRILTATDPDAYIWAEWEGDIDFWDRTGLLEDIKTACGIQHRLVAAKQYGLGIQLGELLLNMEVHTDCNTDLYDVLHVEELLVVGDFPLKDVVRDQALALYFTSENAPQEIWSLACKWRRAKLTLQDMFAALGGVPDGFEDFLHAWLHVLAHEERPAPSSLYQEALNMLPGFEEKLECVQAYGDYHPEGYLLLLREERFQPEQRLRAGLEGVQNILPEFKIRGTLAAEASELASVLSQPQEEIEALWKEAFLSDTCPVNYLRLLLNAENYEEICQWLNTALQRSLPMPDYRESLLARNSMSPFERRVYQVLQGDYSLESPDGSWRPYTVQDRADLLFYTLYQGDIQGKVMLQAEKNVMKNLGFEPAQYWLGLQSPMPTGTEQEIFRQVMQQWRAKVPQPSPEEALGILSSLEDVIAKAVKAVLQDTQRREYPRCAYLLAGLGTTRESLGVSHALQETLTHYANTWPRHAAFRAELRTFGWKG